MKSILKLLFATVIIAAASCSGNGSKNTADTDSTASYNSNSTDAAIDSNKKQLKAEDSTAVFDDTKFAVAAANGGLLEVQLGKLAKTKAISPKVIEFANMMVTDHSKANKELMAIAGTKTITLPAILDNKTQKDYDDMAKLGKADFEKAYTDYMVKDHKEDIDEFQKEADKGKDAELKAFAAKHVPILKHHLEMAQQANDQLRNKRNSL
jgi:putative membrane protein